jgi:hypothetical protein
VPLAYFPFLVLSILRPQYAQTRSRDHQLITDLILLSPRREYTSNVEASSHRELAPFEADRQIFSLSTKLHMHFWYAATAHCACAPALPADFFFDV